MKKILTSPIFWGVLLILGGVLFLLDTFNIISIDDLLWLIITAVAGVLFVAVYLFNHDHWWALIPGIILLALATLIGLTTYLPGFSDSNLEPLVIFGGIALSFLLVYLADRMNWWAIIPMGIMATLGSVAVLSNQTRIPTSGIFFLGLGLTFVLVAILPNKVGSMKWAWIPGGILGVFGLVLLVAQEDLLNYIWPLALIICGLQLIIRSFRR
ncbi:MAG: hypothetical protein C3F13_15490 [Anaerolineales bacterium]|nr:MAG: hypothetical protein C3F13_15490 [Anaerolineales bacterium]